MKTPKEVAIQTVMKDKGINSNAIDFFISMLNTFEVTEVITSTSQVLANNFGCNKRSIQRYVKTLKDHDLIYVKPIYNNDNPNKSYIEKNEYTKTRGTLKLENKAEAFMNRDRNVFFTQKVVS